jgi:glycerol-3-phosphate dehydrogenase
MMKWLSEELDFSYKNNGSLVVCPKGGDRRELEALLERGKANGVEGLRIVEKDELRKMEPNIADDAEAALFAPTAGIVCPFGMTIGFAENAAMNGAEFRMNTKVQNIRRMEGGYLVETSGGDIKTRTIVNAAGVYADAIHNMVSDKPLHITARKGEYYLLDKSAGKHVEHTIFALPTAMGKGVLVTPTVHGNLLVGPTAEDTEDKEGVNTTRAGLDEIAKRAKDTVKNVPLREVITTFAGLRAHEQDEDFVIRELSEAPGFVDVAGIESPGLSAGPAIGCMAAEIICEILNPEEKLDFNPERMGVLNPAEMTEEERNGLIRIDPAYGNIICRCESVSEGEILDAIHRPLGARSLDAVKRRTRAGMGRCQAGFCSPKVMAILERELALDPTELTKAGPGSELVVGLREGLETADTKGGE